MAKRKYNVKGIKDFIVLAGIFFLLCLWAIKDAWFPSQGVLDKHPIRVEVAFPIDGMIKEFNVAVGDSVLPPKEGKESTLLASLNDVTLQEKFETKKAAYKNAQEGTPEKAALLDEVTELKEELEQYKLYCPELGKEKGGNPSIEKQIGKTQESTGAIFPGNDRSNPKHLTGHIHPDLFTLHSCDRNRGTFQNPFTYCYYPGGYLCFATVQLYSSSTNH